MKTTTKIVPDPGNEHRRRILIYHGADEPFAPTTSYASDYAAARAAGRFIRRFQKTGSFSP